MAKEKHAFTNHLIHESSPYLLQHAHNPVNWYPWGKEALEKAQKENKLLIVSIGYAACHWCHVMEHESFEDTAVAKLMNDHFVCIKVDREERPDIDNVYMTACHLSGRGSCGWPLNAFALPDGRPFWAGTYFPKQDWMEILTYFADMYRDDPQRLQKGAEAIARGLQQVDQVPVGAPDELPRPEDLSTATRNMLQIIDYQLGGRAGRPKFPMPVNYAYLLRQYKLTAAPKTREAVEVTLDHMARGGIYDQVGGGFARYSTDDRWLVPHFEKMLYDNGQLVSLYANAWKVTQKDLYRRVVDETIRFVNRELSDPAGGFYSSLDADSDGEEGKFYVWTLVEVRQVLNDDQLFSFVKDYYNLTQAGNWEHGKNILHVTEPLDRVAKRHGLGIEAARKMRDQTRQLLLQARAKRVRPRTDDKVLTSWNALMLKGLVDAYLAFGKPEYLDRALNNAQFLAGTMMQDDGRLWRNYKDGKASINAFLDDYALLADAFIRLYEATFDEQWLYRSKKLTDYALQHFYDASTGLYYYTSDLDPPLVVRKKELSDNVIPASNSTLGRVLWKLHHYFYDAGYADRARTMLRNMKRSFLYADQAYFYANWLTLYSEMATPFYEVVFAGPRAHELRAEMSRHYLPDVLYAGATDRATIGLLEDRIVPGQDKIYVCRNHVCKFPVETVPDALKLLRD